MPLLDLTGYRLTFDDEFNTRSISQTGQGTTWADIRSQWRYDANSDIGFGHSSFVDPASGYDPFSVQGGALAITAVPDRTKFGYPGSWESGLITTQGNFSQTYGYFEMRADLADAKGGWDAFWLLPTTPAANPTNLPGWQELDVVEHYGAYNQGTYRWIHTTDPGPNKNPNSDLQVFSNNPTQVTGYHTYGMDWQKDTISFYFDGQFMGSRPTPSDMHGPMYLLANLATQTDADEAGVPMTLKIDYIRAYSSDPNATAVTQQTVSAPDGQDPGLYGATAAKAPAPVVKPISETVSFARDGYLAANGDVAKAGMDPLTHYQQHGWKEGRDPSAGFDVEQYLAHNPDVKAAGIDPFTHYLQNGQAEGRQTYAAIGKPADFTHGSFDAEYYLLANPDVAKLVLATGGDTLALAYQHYQTNGWQEGRKGDAFFDTAYYVAHNADVAAAHIDPLAHYDQFGWKEGRDPSAAFSTNAYLAANPDVAAAHIDPLLHYLQFGALEGRHLG